jgi:hypothetical protein
MSLRRRHGKNPFIESPTWSSGLNPDAPFAVAEKTNPHHDVIMRPGMLGYLPVRSVTFLTILPRA